MAFIPDKYIARFDAARSAYRKIHFYGSGTTVENTEKKNQLISFLSELLNYAK